jgi:ABC-type Fe3+-hydroxamate transport system substrate-binding protein
MGALVFSVRAKGGGGLVSMKRLWVLLFALLAAFPATAAERILALAPHACEILYAIGAGKEIVGAVDYCDWPPEAARIPRAGNYLGVNTEAALRLAPTLAIAFNAADPGLIPLKKQGIRVLVSDPRSLDDILTDIRRIGDASGHAPAAMALVARMRKRISAVRTRSPKRELPTFYEIWPQPLRTSGRDSFITDVMELAGFHNVFANVPGESARVNLESVIRAGPEVVIVPDEKRDITARRKYWRKWLGRKVRVIRVSHDLLHRPGPRIVDGLQQLLAARLRLGQ